MFTDEELELIEEILTANEDFVQTRIERQRLDAILQKIDRHLNG